MEKKLEKLPREILELIRLAGDVAKANGMRAYLVGGFVRDLLLGRQNFDLDIVAEGDGIKFAEELSVPLRARLVKHKRFGTATLHLGGALKVDIASSREESYAQPACLPKVSPGALKSDLCRRDFTINAMALDISRDDFGRLVDVFDGQSDLKAKKIRVLHDISFIDDPTRMLRAVRFEQRFSFRIEKHSLELLRSAAKQGLLQRVEPQRLRDELILLLKEPDPIRQIKRVDSLLGFAFVDNRLKLSPKTYSLLASAAKVMEWFNHAYPHHRKIESWLVYLMGLLDPLSKERALAVCRKFAIRRGEEMRILSAKRLEVKLLKALSAPKIRPSRSFALLEPLSYEAIILLKAKAGKKARKAIDDFFARLHGTRLHISGHDLARMGIKPGPEYQKIFTRILRAKVDGSVKNKEEEIELLKKIKVPRLNT